MKKKIFIIIPAMVIAGPVKGAIALANGLVGNREVTLVSLKRGSGASAPIHPFVKTIDLSLTCTWMIGKIRNYRKMLVSGGGRQSVVSISMCFSADIVNLACRGQAMIYASVRGNLPINYRMDYGFFLGVPLAYFHLKVLMAFDHVVVMTDAMAGQVRRYIGNPPSIVGNFIDENALEKYRLLRDWDGPPRFVFLGSLSRRKRSVLVVKAIKELHSQGVMASLDIIGSGPLANEIKDIVDSYGLGKYIKLHGQLTEPYPLVAAADALVLPSTSEGVPRAALEALHLGTPCVLRAVDGNSSLIQVGINGALFNVDTELVDSMMEASRLSRQKSKSMLPSGFRQHEEADRLLKIFES